MRDDLSDMIVTLLFYFISVVNFNYIKFKKISLNIYLQHFYILIFMFIFIYKINPPKCISFEY